MAKFQDLFKYYRPWRTIALFSIIAACFFEIIDLVVPYVIGQILNLLSNQPLDRPLQEAIVAISQLTNLPRDRSLSLIVLMGFIFVVTVGKGPTQTWS